MPPTLCESVSRASRQLEGDIADLARESTALKRENAVLRQQMAELLEQSAIAHQAHAVNAVRVALLERLARELVRSAEEHPHWPLSRWVKFGPMASLLTSIKERV